MLNQFLDTHDFFSQSNVPDAAVGPCCIPQVMEDPAYLPLVEQSAKHGSYPRSPDQALVLAGDPTTGPEEYRGKTVSSYRGRAKRKEATL